MIRPEPLTSKPPPVYRLVLSGCECLLPLPMTTYKTVNLKYLPPSSVIELCTSRQVSLLRFGNFYEDTNDLIYTYVCIYVCIYCVYMYYVFFIYCLCMLHYPWVILHAIAYINSHHGDFLCLTHLET